MKDLKKRLLRPFGARNDERSMYAAHLTDTIAAISTPIGEAGIGIVRVSGMDALKIADKVFVAKDGRKPASFKTYTTHYGWIIRKSKIKYQKSKFKKLKESIDEVILTVMRAPKSYTKEDIVEVNCHGGIVAQRAVLDLVLENGARLAEPGEFTKRAFLNGRIDLTQAEAVLDIIRAKTDSALKISTEQLRGGLSSKINNLRKELLEILAILEVKIDFPEEETGRLDLKEVNERLWRIDSKLKSVLKTAGQGRVLREGIQLVICGKPNVGKSSLLNALLRQERSIVTPVAGTTRDTIEEIMDIRGIPVRIVDTAGIIEPRDLIEKEAVLRSRRCMESADLVILLFDGSRRLAKEDEMLIRRLRQKRVLAVLNKIDLKQKIERGRIIKRFKYIVETSAKESRNINLLEEAIANLVYNGRVSNSEPILISNLRHIEAMKSSQKLVAESLSSLDNELSIEFIAQGLKDALGYLDDILGKRFSEGLLDRIFSKFCIGK